MLPSSAPRRHQLRLLVAGALLCGLPGQAPALAQGQPAVESAPDAAGEEELRLRREYAALLRKKYLLERERELKELQLELSTSDQPYLLLDLEDNAIFVVVRAMPVKRVPITAAELEGQRGLFAAEGPPSGWVSQTFELLAKSGDLVQPEKIVPPDQEAVAEEIDPRAVTPDLVGLDKDPEYPGRYTLLYREGIAVTLSGGILTEEERGWIASRLSRLTSILLPPDVPVVPDLESPRVWIHLTLPGEEAQNLYPSLFAGMRAMVRLPGDPRL